MPASIRHGIAGQLVDKETSMLTIVEDYSYDTYQLVGYSLEDFKPRVLSEWKSEI